MRSDLPAIALALATYGCFSALDASAKYLGAAYPVAMIIWVRYVGHLLAVGATLSLRHGSGIWRPPSPGLQWIRSGLLLASTGCNFVAIQHLQLAQSVSIMFAAPLLVCALSGPMLGETVGLRRWIAVVVGLCGVLVIVRPGGDGLHWAMLVSLASALATALYQITTRRLAATDPAASTQVFTALAGALALTPMVPWSWTTPAWIDLPVFIGLGVFGGVGHWVMVMAHQRAPAAVLAPFAYSQILWMVGLGWLVFGDLPDAPTLTGGAIVAASGLYLVLVPPGVSAAAGSHHPADRPPRP